MPVRYEWKVAKNGTRKFVRTFVADQPTIEVPDEPTEPVVTPKKPTVRRRRKPAAKKSDG